MKKTIFASMAFMLMFFTACSSDNQIFSAKNRLFQNNLFYYLL